MSKYRITFKLFGREVYKSLKSKGFEKIETIQLLSNKEIISKHECSIN